LATAASLKSAPLGNFAGPLTVDFAAALPLSEAVERRSGAAGARAGTDFDLAARDGAAFGLDIRLGIGSLLRGSA